MHVGTLIYTWLRGERVGKDEYGNRYYRSGRGKLHGRERRWVLYKGRAEASKVPPEWHAWLHHTTDEPLLRAGFEPLPWQRKFVPNLTGTADAYRPQGHQLRGGHRASATGDYEPWSPD